MVLAGSVGFAARAVGRGARDLDPHHRRDGMGLLTLGVAIVLGASLWGRMNNAVGRAIQTVVGGALVGGISQFAIASATALRPRPAKRRAAAHV